jgi:uncharacterized membrane protein
MTSTHPATEAWAKWWRKLDALHTALKELTHRGTTNVTAKGTRNDAKEACQFYFREVRQHLVDLGIDSEQIAQIDSEMQEIITIATKVTRTDTYRKFIKALNKLRAPIEAAIEIAATSASAPGIFVTTSTEETILKMLDQIVPTAALSYQQLLRDLADLNRTSYRGTASELREVLRELLDHLAPDGEVIKTGIKLEQGRTKPTMKQKTIFILKARGINETQRKTARDATEAVEGAVGSLARSVYDRGSLSTHIETSRQEVMTFKGYADAVLAELLEIHKV